MRIGVDACCWANGRGYGRFTRELLRHMVSAAPDHEFVCILDTAAADAFDLAAPNLRVVRAELGASPTEAASADGYRSPADLLRLTRCVGKLSLDVFFSPSVYTYFPLPPRLRAVVAIHDAIADRYPELTLPSRRARLFWRMKVWLALRQSRLVLTVSDFSARELTEVLGVAPERIRVSLEAPAARYTPSETPARIQDAAGRAGLACDSRWFIYVGGFNPHKNVDAIVRAHGKLASESADPPHLLLVGRTDGDVFHGNLEQIRSAIRGAGTESLVHWTGFLEDDEVRHLHSGALALLLPSECEGFGLPAVEAAACGTPVIATTQSPLPQLLEGGGFFVPPGDDAALEDAMRQLAGSEVLRKRMGERAREKANQLSWSQSADAALAAIEEAAA